MDLIIGCGEVGKSLNKVISQYYSAVIYDKSFQLPISNYFRREVIRIDFMHICFPYSPTFVQDVKQYKEIMQPRFTVIHSTVPVGTSSLCEATHSPIIGKHPFMDNSIKTFTKFVGGKDADAVAEHFRSMDIKVQICRKSSTTELAKIADTTFYAVCIEYIKGLERKCSLYDVPFSEVFTLYQQNYNKGWSELGYPEYSRPVLQPIQSKQGGHCTVSNLDFYNSKFSDLVKHLNERDWDV